MGRLKRIFTRVTRASVAAETNYGRSAGWDIELEGRVIGRLDEPRWEDMFWVSYHLTATTNDPALAAELLSEAFWRGDGWARLIFRSRALGLAATHAFPAKPPFVAPMRLNMRGLYVIPEDD